MRRDHRSLPCLGGCNEGQAGDPVRSTRGGAPGAAKRLPMSIRHGADRQRQPVPTPGPLSREGRITPAPLSHSRFWDALSTAKTTGGERTAGYARGIAAASRAPTRARSSPTDRCRGAAAVASRGLRHGAGQRSRVFVAVSQRSRCCARAASPRPRSRLGFILFIFVLFYTDRKTGHCGNGCAEGGTSGEAGQGGTGPAPPPRCSRARSRSALCLGGHRAGAAGTCCPGAGAGRARSSGLTLAPRRAAGEAPPGTLRACHRAPPRASLRPPPAPPARGSPGEVRPAGRAATLPCRVSPPPWQDSAGSAEQPFSAAASPPELCRAVGPGGGTARGGPLPRCLPPARTSRARPGGAGGRRGCAAGLAVTIPPVPRHFVTVLAFSQSKDRAGALGTGPRCAGAGGPSGPGPRSPPPARRRTWQRGRSRDARPPAAPLHRDRPAPLCDPRVVAVWVHAGRGHAGLAHVSGSLSLGEGGRSAITSLPS